MFIMHKYIILIYLSIFYATKQWPYNRYRGVESKNGRFKAQTSHPEFKAEPHSKFGQWFHQIVKLDHTGQLQGLFTNGSVPRGASFEDLLNNLNIPEKAPGNVSRLPPHVPRPWPQQEAKNLFANLPYPVDPRCTSDRSKW